MSDDFRVPDFQRLNTMMIENIRAQAERAEVLAGRKDASEIHAYLLRRIRDYQEEVPDECEVGIRLANFGVAETLHIRTIKFRNPNLIEFSGLLPDGSSATLIQHISQLSFLLVAVSPLASEAPYRIGFGAQL